MRTQRSVNDTIAWLAAADDPEAVAGNAFLISSNLALTCAHVIRDHLGLARPSPPQLPTQTIQLSFPGLRVEIEARVAPSGWWPEGSHGDVDDIAVLELTKPLENLRIPTVAAFLPVGEANCEVFGAPGGYQRTGQMVQAARGKTELGALGALSCSGPRDRLLRMRGLQRGTRP